MKHDDARHKLSEYIDGSTTAEEKAAIEDHLKTCSSCSDALRELQKTVEHIKSIEEVEPPVWMTQKIMAKVRAGAEEKKGLLQKLFFPLSVKLPIQAAAVLFLTVSAFYIYRNIQPTPMPSEAPVQEFAAGNGAPPAPAPREKHEEPRIAKDSSVPAKKVPQAPEYKALDMKPAYEKPEPPAALGKAAAAESAGASELLDREEEKKEAVQLKVSEVFATGGLTRDAVRMAAEHQVKSLTGCIPATQPGAKIKFKVTTDASGAVKNVEIVSQKITDKAVEQCLRRMMKEWRFDANTAGKETEALITFQINS